MERVLITGVSSFTARHLLPVLAEEYGIDALVGTDLTVSGALDFPAIPADLTRRDDVEVLVAQASPSRVFHLAGTFSPDPDLCFRLNLDGTRHLLSALAALPSPPRVLLVSSAAVYGLTVPEESPIKETTPFRPLASYGASKAAAEILAMALHRERKLPVTVVRPFNLVGPGLPRGLAPADFAAQVRAIRDEGAEPVLWTGNLAPRRDFVDVRDAARAYVALLRNPATAGRAFNLGSGRATAMRTLLESLLRLAGVQARIETDPARVRAIDVEEQIADVTALTEAISWVPAIPLEQSLRDMLQS